MKSPRDIFPQLSGFSCRTMTCLSCVRNRLISADNSYIGVRKLAVRVMGAVETSILMLHTIHTTCTVCLSLKIDKTVSHVAKMEAVLRTDFPPI